MTLHDQLVEQQLSLSAAQAAVEQAKRPLLELAEAELAKERAEAGLTELQEKWSAQKVLALQAWAEIEACAVESNQLALVLEAKGKELKQLCAKHTQLLRDVNARDPLHNAEILEHIPWCNILGGLMVRIVTIYESKRDRSTPETLALMERNSSSTKAKSRK